MPAITFQTVDLKPGSVVYPLDRGPRCTLVDGAEGVLVVDGNEFSHVVKLDDGEEYAVDSGHVSTYNTETV